jgi:putative transposase
MQLPTAKDRDNVALKRFALIAPVLNGQVPSQKEYFDKLCVSPIDMPYYGLKSYSPKTLAGWLNDYRRGGLDALKPGYRSDRGHSRKVSLDIADKIREKRAAMPRITSILLYEELVKDKVILPQKLSRATFYRFLAANPDLAAGLDPEVSGEKELRRFSRQFVNELWQTDLMYGPYLKVGKSKQQTYLLAFIDDASRLITHGQFFFSQNFSALRVAFKEAILKRGVPKMLYTDNGKVYRSGQMALLCANLGCSLIHAEPFTPTSKGKIERFFHTVRSRFLTRVDPTKIRDLGELNLMFCQWLEEDYQRKIHSSLNMSPLDFFMSQANQVNIFSNPAVLEEYLLLRINRKVNHDATLSVDSILYETEPSLSNSRLEVRYDPDWLKTSTIPLLLYKDGLKVGEARQVNFQDNSRIKRKGKGRPKTEGINPGTAEALSITTTVLPAQTISFASMMDNQSDEKEGEC